MPRIMHEAVIDILREHFAAYPNLDKLVILKQEVYYDHRARTPDYRTIYEQTIWCIQQYPYEKLLRALELRNGPLMLELCMRRLAECEVPLDLTLDDVVDILESLVGIDMPWLQVAGSTRKMPKIRYTSRHLSLRAFAACAWMHFDASFKLPYGDSLYSMADTDFLQKAARSVPMHASGLKSRRASNHPSCSALLAG